ncbi:rhodanese-like domain-containing protein [Actibacterium sp. XHP0104]|uniref:rhodanese-like domain-containing protein n=1 Tax=Actibacterium sp. XHP0104 TaxID=2984335 RepID=UPI0021E8769A|nr:rhodanese-like domain-containing protein [Actibacterium sp. XHP0104]MCV2880828.1 rhodanese-like domain-containing protein [Actibacterium sp. XHP0104]
MFSMFSGPRVAVLDAAEAVQKVAAGEMTLIDVRDAAELRATGHAAGALHIPLPVLQMKVDPRSPEHLPELTLDRPIALYCASGGRSQMAAQMMMQMGYEQVYNIGGLHHWQVAGGALSHA